LIDYQFFRTQGSVYLSVSNDMSNLVDAIDALADQEWFANSVIPIINIK